MTLYYTDERKYLRRTKTPITSLETDKDGDQFVHVTGTIFGITLRPSKRWTPFCDRLFRKMNATGVRLEDIRCAPGKCLGFINDLPGCRRLSIEGGDGVELAPLANNAHLEDVQIGPSVRLVNEFDLTSLRKLQRCFIPYVFELMSFLRCSKLICLGINGGRHEGIIELSALSSLEEFICANVAKVRGVVFDSDVRLRSLELLHMKDFESLKPQAAVTRELLNVQLNKVPKMKLEWLQQAEKIECIALRLGEIPTVNFLKGLKHLQVLDLFGSKVKDGDLSFRDSLKGELDSKLWSSKR